MHLQHLPTKFEIGKQPGYKYLIICGKVYRKNLIQTIWLIFIMEIIPGTVSQHR